MQELPISEADDEEILPEKTVTFTESMPLYQSHINYDKDEPSDANDSIITGTRVVTDLSHHIHSIDPEIQTTVKFIP